ncbi:MAG: hypothetical protein CMH70_00350 [Nitrosomonadaceae bacterium]|nr:hypothetical protein [Nitrosomonadaceae bacterium]|tara:strand:+ start:7397 stop:7591 length:195 start_codon:yes stop_codon:yes gene_type:complete
MTLARFFLLQFKMRKNNLLIAEQGMSNDKEYIRPHFLESGIIILQKQQNHQSQGKTGEKPSICN